MGALKIPWHKVIKLARPPEKTQSARVHVWMGPHLCRALAVQYLRFLSGSLTWPSLQHWPHTNFIFRLRGRPLPAPNPPTGLTPLPPMQSPPTPTPPPPPIPPSPPTGTLLLGWGIWMGWNKTNSFIKYEKTEEWIPALPLESYKMHKLKDIYPILGLTRSLRHCTHWKRKWMIFNVVKWLRTK